MNTTIKKTIGFSNFKAFGNRLQTFNVKPITLIYSPNSVGKSSVVHAITYLNYLIQGGNPDLYSTKRLGDTIDLGGFSNFVHKHETDRDITFRITVNDAEDLLKEYFDKFTEDDRMNRYFLRCYDEENLKAYLFHESKTSIGIEIKVGISNDDSDHGLNIELSYFIDDEWLLKVNNFPFKSKIKINSAHPLATSIWNSKYVSFSIKNALPLNYQTTSMEFDGENEIVFGVDFPSIPKDLEKLGAGKLHSKNSIINYELFRRNSLFLISHLNKIFDFHRDSSIQEDVIDPSFNYLAPLRFYPEREFAVKGAKLANDYRDGEPLNSENAWYFLGEKYEIGEAINEWLSDPKKLATTYKIRHQKLIDLKSVEDLMQSHDFKHLSDDEKIKQLKLKVESEKMVFQDLKKGVEVNNRDLGLGISQIIPILVATNGLLNQTIVIEQPELHLHPKAQCELADEFIKSYHNKGNSFVLETHSEHLLLRMMRRMRHTAAGKVENEVLKLSPADICLLYVHSDGDTTYLEELELSADGRLKTRWPSGFFEERYNERFDLDVD